MKQKRHTTDQIISKLRRADQELGQGKKVAEVCRILEINVQTYYRWRQKYGGMDPSMAKELKSLQKENGRERPRGPALIYYKDQIEDPAERICRKTRSCVERAIVFEEQPFLAWKMHVQGYLVS